MDILRTALFKISEKITTQMNPLIKQRLSNRATYRIGYQAEQHEVGEVWEDVIARGTCWVPAPDLLLVDV